jgi:hypothetical protein
MPSCLCIRAECGSKVGQTLVKRDIGFAGPRWVKRGSSVIFDKSGGRTQIKAWSSMMAVEAEHIASHIASGVRIA